MKASFSRKEKDPLLVIIRNGFVSPETVRNSRPPFCSLSRTLRAKRSRKRPRFPDACRPPLLCLKTCSRSPVSPPVEPIVDRVRGCTGIGEIEIEDIDAVEKLIPYGEGLRKLTPVGVQIEFAIERPEAVPARFTTDNISAFPLSASSARTSPCQDRRREHPSSYRKRR